MAHNDAQQPSAATKLLPKFTRYVVMLAGSIFAACLFVIGASAIHSRYIYSRVGLHGKPWFPYPLFEKAAVYAGFALISGGVAILSMLCFFGFRRYFPSWTRWIPWFFFLAWIVFVHLANRRG